MTGCDSVDGASYKLVFLTFISIICPRRDNKYCCINHNLYNTCRAFNKCANVAGTAYLDLARKENIFGGKVEKEPHVNDDYFIYQGSIVTLASSKIDSSILYSIIVKNL